MGLRSCCECASTCPTFCATSTVSRMLYQPTLSSSCLLRWLMPLLSAMGNLIKLIVSGQNVKFVIIFNFMIIYTVIFFILKERYYLFMYLYFVTSGFGFSQIFNYLSVLKTHPQISFAGDRRNHGFGHAFPACTGALDTRKITGYDRAGFELSLCW